MIVVVGSSIAIQILAIFWSLKLLRRIKDWRIGFLTIMFVLMAVRQLLTLWHTPASSLTDFTLASSELPGLMVSLMAFLSVVALEKILTAPKKAEANLKEVEERFRQLTENLEEIFWMTSIDGEEILYVSPAYETIFQRKAADLYKNPKSWLSFILPEDRPQVTEAFKQDNLVRGLFNVEYRMKRPDGSIRWIKAKGFPVKNSLGETYRIAGIATDITHQKITELALKNSQIELEQRVEERTADLAESEERFRKMFEEGGIGMVMANPDLYFTTTNRAFREMIGFTEDELKSKTFLDLTHPDDIGNNIEQIQRLVKHEISSFQMEKRCVCKDGRVIWVNINVFIIHVRSQEPSYNFIGVMENITQRKEAETKIRNAQDKAEKANRAKSEFLSHMSHELRTPLNAILGFAQLLEMDRKHTLEPRQKKSVLQIRSAGNHLLELINEVLDMTRIETGSLKIFNENTDVSLLLKRLLPVVEPIAEKKNIQIRNQILESVLYVFADSTRLKQALLNLVANAIKYNRENGEVFITGETTDDNRVKIHVQDTGPGIEPEQQESIFKPFERLGAEHSDVEGTGIGLSLTQKLVGLMGGTVTLKSEVGKGSCFTIELPGGAIADPIPPERHLEHTCLPDPAEEKHDYKTILYIEDNISNLNLIKRYIEECSSFRMLTSQNPIDGLKLARKNQPSLILMDINLPEMDGIQAFKELQKYEETKSIPVIAVSANAMNYDIKKALDVGFKTYVTKPVELPQLMDTIHQTLNLSTK